MLFNGVREYGRDGGGIKTVLVVGRAARDGELKTTQGGRTFGAVSVRAFGRQDGTAAFLEVKSFQDAWARLIASLSKGDAFLAAGRLETREYNGRTCTDLLADFIITGGGDARPRAANAPKTGVYNGPSPGGDWTNPENGELPF